MTEFELSLIDLDQPLEGYRQFLSCWVYRSPNLTFIVDPGPRGSAPHLLGRLSDMGVSHIDFVLLSHIHLDHGGGAAEVLEAYPGARLYCHENAAAHLVRPEKLWQGSLKVLGPVALVYGEPRALAAESIAQAKEVEARGIRVIPTPGHAVHHVSFACGDVLFAGEVFGTRMPTASGRPYLRPATPPRFFLPEALASIDKLLALDPLPRRVAFAHYGMAGDLACWCGLARAQLSSWVLQLRDLCAVSGDAVLERFFERLMLTDPTYGQGLLDELPHDIQARERHFLNNTVQGMLGYLAES